MKNFIEQISMF